MDVIFAYEDGQVDVIQQDRLGRYLSRAEAHDEWFSKAYFNKDGNIHPLSYSGKVGPFDEDDYAVVNFVFTTATNDVWAYGSYEIDGRA